MAQELDVIKVWEDLHKTPELGFEEHETAKYIAEKLTALGYEVETGEGGTGVVGVIKGEEEGPCLMLRADMVFTPGSGGTFMEVFEEAALNHYATYDASCPMIFFGKTFWTRKAAFYPFLEKLIDDGLYKNIKLSVTDDLFDVIKTVEFWQKNLT